MEILIALLIIFVALDVAALKGWAPDTRDSRDWNVPDTGAQQHAPVAR
jgi:hypothetical protein